MLGTLLLMLGLWKNVKYLNAKTFFPTLLGIVDTFIFSIDAFKPFRALAFYLVWYYQMSDRSLIHSKTNDRVNMQKRYGFLRTERDVKETKKKLDERLALVLLGYNIRLDLGLFKF